MYKANYLLILIGLPASGKSTFAQLFKEIVESEGVKQVIVIDPDKIRKKLYPEDFNYQKENEVRERNITQIRTALKNNFIVVSDDLNYYTSMRHDLKKVAEECNKNYFIVHISTPLKICLDWNEKRGKLIPNDVIININNKFDLFKNYSWDFPLLTLDLSKVSDLEFEIRLLLKKIEKRLISSQTKFEKKEKFQDFDSEYNKKLDKETRKIVGQILKNNLYHPKKENIIKLRREFIKTYINTKLNSSEISDQFIKFLNKRLKLKI
ncbi:MAG: AAA family ATPase [Candidatus Thorarchaeota archaeon]